MALKLQGAIGSSGLERIGFEPSGPEASRCNWLERIGSSGLERIGLEPCGLEVSHSIWPERARAKGQENLDPSDQTDHFWSQDWIIFETKF